MALNNGLHYDLTDFKQPHPYFCWGAGNIVPRVFLFSVVILGNEKPWGRGWRRQFDV